MSFQGMESTVMIISGLTGPDWLRLAQAVLIFHHSYFSSSLMRIKVRRGQTGPQILNHRQTHTQKEPCFAIPLILKFLNFCEEMQRPRVPSANVKNKSHNLQKKNKHLRVDGANKV